MIDRDVIPSRDSDFDTFQNTLYTQTNLNAAAWQIDPAKIAALLPYKTDWEAKWAIAKEKSLRTPVETRLKDLARAAYEVILRPFIKGLYINPMMNGANLEACGLKEHDTTRTPVPVPSTLPQVDWKTLSGHRVKIFFTQEPDEQGVSRRGKPEGVRFCEFAYSVDVQPATPKECPNKVLASRAPQVAHFEQEEQGKKIYFYARWVNTRGETGPWTDQLEFMVP